jgi:hypothetical protein
MDTGNVVIDFRAPAPPLKRKSAFAALALWVKELLDHRRAHQSPRRPDDVSESEVLTASTPKEDFVPEAPTALALHIGPSEGATAHPGTNATEETERAMEDHWRCGLLPGCSSKGFPCC